MGAKFTQLTDEERIEIYALLKAKISKREIARRPCTGTDCRCHARRRFDIRQPRNHLSAHTNRLGKRRLKMVCTVATMPSRHNAI
jgi:IS30 family transposase